MLARLDSRRRLLRVKVRRAFNNYRIELLLQQPAVALQPGKTLRGPHLELLAHRIHALLKIIRHGNKVIAAMLLKEFRDPFAAFATADQAEVNFRVRPRGASQSRLQDRKGQDRSPGSGQKPAARKGSGIVSSVRGLRGRHWNPLLGCAYSNQATLDQARLRLSNLVRAPLRFCAPATPISLGFCAHPLRCVAKPRPRLPGKQRV